MDTNSLTHNVLDTVAIINHNNGHRDHTIADIAINTIHSTEHHFTQESNGDMLATRYSQKMTIGKL